MCATKAYTDEAFYADICAILKRHVPCKHTSCLYEVGLFVCFFFFFFFFKFVNQL